MEAQIQGDLDGVQNLKFAVRSMLGYENNKVCTKWEILYVTILGEFHNIGYSLYDTKEDAEYHARLMEAKFYD